MPESWLTAVEHHVSFGFIVMVCTFLLSKHRLYLRFKDRMNDLWWDRCGLKKEPYTPVENGTPAVIPPTPEHFLHFRKSN